MFSRRVRTAVLVVAASLGLSACSTYDGYGYGYGGGGYYGGSYGLADRPYYGWYDDFYYPGTGYYVYDRGGRRHSWNRNQRDYWMSRARNRGDRQEIRQNYREFRADRRNDRLRHRVERRANREALRSGQMSREQFRAEQRGDRRQFRQERRTDQRQLQRQNRGAIRN